MIWLASHLSLAFFAGISKITVFMSSESESTGVFDLLTWYETNKQKIFSVGTVAFGVGLILYVSNHFKTQAELDASNALFEARYRPATANSGEEPAPQDPAKLMGIASEHAGQAAAGRATLFAAQAFFEQGDYTQALEQFERYLAQHADSPLKGTAMYGRAACQEALERSAEAIEGYKSINLSFPNTYLAHQSNLAEAGLHEDAGEPALALALYDRVLLPTVSSRYTAEAGSRREALLKKHPELAPAEAEANDAEVAVEAQADQ